MLLQDVHESTAQITTNSAVPNPWRERAQELAAWAWTHLVNRTDFYGQYQRPDQRQRGNAHTRNSPLIEPLIAAHFYGLDHQSLIGLHPISSAQRCKFGALDIDRHDENKEQVTAAGNLKAAQMAVALLKEFASLDGVIEDSDGQGSNHVWVFFKEPQPAGLVKALLDKVADRIESSGLAPRPEVFPKQTSVEPKKPGNWIRLPGRHHTRDHWSRFYNNAENRWMTAEESVDFLLHLEPQGALCPNAIEAENNEVHQIAAHTPDNNKDDADADYETYLEMLADWRIDDYESWLKIGMIGHATNPDPLGQTYLAWEQRSAKSEKYNQGDCAQKWRTFKDRGDRNLTIGTLKKWASEDQRKSITSRIDECVKKINEEYALAYVGSDTRILHELKDQAGRITDLKYRKKHEVQLFYENQTIQTGPRKRECVFGIWLHHRDRRTYQGVRYAPGQELPSDIYNLWRGFAVEPVEGDCRLFLDFVKDVICTEDEKLYAYVIAWLADAVQNLEAGKRPGVSLVLRGGRGVGKSTFAHEFGKLFGVHYIYAEKRDQFTGRFNAHLEYASLAFADEAFFAADRSSISSLKSLITEKTIRIEGKGRDSYEALNHTRLIMASNSDWVVPAGIDERRFCVLDVSDKHKQDHEYFRRLKTFMENGGRSALLNYLLNYDISKVNLRRAPKTKALLDQKLRSLDTAEAFWFEALTFGAIMRSAFTSIDEVWSTSIATEKVQEAYYKFSKNIGASRRAESTALGKTLKRLCPKMGKRKAAILDPDTNTSKRCMVYDLPNLADCREAFEQALGEKINWPDGDEDCGDSEQPDLFKEGVGQGDEMPF